MEHKIKTQELKVSKIKIEPVQIQGNPTSLLQVFVNLTINAMHAMGERGTDRPQHSGSGLGGRGASPATTDPEFQRRNSTKFCSRSLRPRGRREPARPVHLQRNCLRGAPRKSSKFRITG